MKYIDIRFDSGCWIKACSHCNNQLRGDENFCPKCGSKLKKIPYSLNKDAIIAFINENIDKLQSPMLETKTNLNDHCLIKSDTAVPNGGTATAHEQEKESNCCHHGQGTPETCGHCTSKGACTFVVHPSIPPQYSMCPFRGSGYINCSEAD